MIITGLASLYPGRSNCSTVTDTTKAIVLDPASLEAPIERG